MPELPDIAAYLRALEPRVLGERLEKIQLSSPFLLRSVDPSRGELEGRKVQALRRLGKRVVLEFEDAYFLVLHLMIAGRLHWREPGAKPGRKGIARFSFSSGTLVLTEAGSKRRAALHLVHGEEALRAPPHGHATRCQAAARPRTFTSSAFPSRTRR